MKPSLRPRWLALVLLLAMSAARCAPPAATPTVTVPPEPAATATPDVSPTPPPTPAPTAQAVTFASGDGIPLQGVQYGAGDVAVIFSPMGDCVGDWAALAGHAAANGLMALTYVWQACQSDGVDGALLRQFVDDLRGAIAFVHAQGAERVILVGASLGGVASAKLLAESGAVGLAILAAPADVPSLDLSVTATDVDSAAPKLFMTAEDDDVVAPDETRALHDLAAEPKEWQTYPGDAHGTHLFATDSGDAAQQRILDFILAAVAP